MKKLFFIAAIAIAALVSCTKNEVAPSASEQQEIAFASPVAQSVTKAVDLVPATYPDDLHFAVYADHHADDYDSEDTFVSYMRGSEGVEVSYKTATGDYDKYWAPEKSYYWPKDGYLTFAAYSPYSASTHEGITFNYSIKNGVTTTYEVKQDLSNQCDFMLSDRKTNQKAENMVSVDPGYDGVQLNFKHALSAIKFKVKTDKDYSTDGYTIALKSIKVKNAYTKGKLTQFADKGTTEVDLDEIWSDQTEETVEGYKVFSVETPANLSDTEYKTFSTDTQADLILLPQDLDHTELVEDVPTGNIVTAEVVYTVAHGDMGGESIEYTANLKLPVTIAGTNYNTWDAGKRYIYTIMIGMQEIVFAPKVDPDWEEGVTAEI